MLPSTYDLQTYRIFVISVLNPLEPSLPTMPNNMSVKKKPKQQKTRTYTFFFAPVPIFMVGTERKQAFKLWPSTKLFSLVWHLLKTVVTKIKVFYRLICPPKLCEIRSHLHMNISTFTQCHSKYVKKAFICEKWKKKIIEDDYWLLFFRRSSRTTWVKTRNLIPRIFICLRCLCIAKLENSSFDLISDYRHNDTAVIWLAFPVTLHGPRRKGNPTCNDPGSLLMSLSIIF